MIDKNTQSSKPVDDLLSLTQSEHIFHRNKTNFLNEIKHAPKGGEEKAREVFVHREVRREDCKVESKTEGSHTKGGQLNVFLQIRNSETIYPEYTDNN